MARLIPERLKELRVDRGLSQAQLADRIGVKREAVTNWEGRSPTPQRSMHQLLADALDTTTDYLIGVTDDPSPRTGPAPTASAPEPPPAWAAEILHLLKGERHGQRAGRGEEDVGSDHGVAAQSGGVRQAHGHGDHEPHRDDGEPRTTRDDVVRARHQDAGSARAAGGQDGSDRAPSATGGVGEPPPWAAQLVQTIERLGANVEQVMLRVATELTDLRQALGAQLTPTPGDEGEETVTDEQGQARPRRRPTPAEIVHATHRYRQKHGIPRDAEMTAEQTRELLHELQQELDAGQPTADDDSPPIRRVPGTGPGSAERRRARGGTRSV